MRYLHRDRAHAVAVLRAVVDAGQHDERTGRVHRIGQRQQQADGGQRAQAGQQPHQGAHRAAQRAEHQVLDRERVAEAEREVVKDVHVGAPFGSVQRQAQAQQLLEPEGDGDQHRRDLHVARHRVRRAGEPGTEHQEDDARDHVHEMGDERETAQTRQDDGDVARVEVQRHGRHQPRAQHRDAADHEQHAADDEREQPRPRMAERAQRVMHRRQAEGQRQRHEDEAPDEIAVVHDRNGLLCGSASQLLPRGGTGGWGMLAVALLPPNLIAG